MRSIELSGCYEMELTEAEAQELPSVGRGRVVRSRDHFL